MKAHCIEKSNHSVNANEGQRKPDHAAGMGIDEYPIEIADDLSEYVLDFWVLGDQNRLLIAPCRALRGMTLRGLIGQGEKDGRTTFSGGPPGSSVIASY